MTAFKSLSSSNTICRAAWGRRARAFVLVSFPFALFGCGSATPPGADAVPTSASGPNDPAWVTNRPKLPPPDADRINYDEQTRTLTLYDLPGNDRWMVRMPGEMSGRAITPQHRLPADTELSQVMVYYARPGVKPSAPVSVKQIRDSGNAHSSLAGFR
ncbi:unnamed protein product [Gemmata massiliana]|uniref:Uncharacterized protein n=1 Tax=Gemmata massiliana TaxID=1210884 RepID=A0A6P2CUF7_9BACT|nr:hypothetical protein [Gemmata massiliana]VTR91785.1 unnamed protein product [Gemmata massiliana]